MNNDQTFPKRLILSSTQKLFDPVGKFFPGNFTAESILQQTWKIGRDLDAPLPDEFRRWYNEINILEDVQITRYVEENESTELHFFVDACKEAYGACICFRTETPEAVKNQLIRTKVGVPRLELIACHFRSRLSHSVQQTFCFQNMKIVSWSDSMVALYCLNEYGE